MPKSVTTAEARALQSNGVPFVDVLPPGSFADEHIDGAVNLPLADINDAPVRLDPAEPVLVYCFDHQ